VVWGAATLLCFPLLLVFVDMVRRVPDGSGLEGFIALGLGRHVAATVPPLFLSLICLGLPAGSLVAGGALLAFMLAVGAGAGWKVLYPLAVFAVALGTSLVRSRRRS
jgi:amino acid efflux transporter